MFKKHVAIIRNHPVFVSSMGLLIITFFVKLLGYAEKIVLAYYYGTSYEVDSYMLVTTVVLAFFYFFREIIEPGYLNTFLRARSIGNEKTAWDIFNKVLRIILLVTVVITILAVIFPDKMVNIFAPGFSGEKLDLSVKLIQIAIPACIFLALSTLTGITLNGLKMFVLPASGELVFKALIIGCLVIFYKSYGIMGAAIGIVAGSIGRLIVHFIKLYPHVSFRPVKSGMDHQKRLWLLTWPLLLGVTFSQVSSLIDNVFASYLQEGAIAALSYSKKIIELPVIIFPSILSIVVFPYFSQLAIEKNEKKLIKLFSVSLRWIIIIFLPLSVFFFVFSTPIIEVIFQRGAFDASSTMLTSRPLAIYSLGLLFFAIEAILVIFYYANADTKTPVFVGMACVILHIILTFVFIHFMGYIGIALAYVIQKIVKNFTLLLLLKRKITIDWAETQNFLLKVALATIVFIATIILCKELAYHYFDKSIITRALFLFSSSLLGGIIYGLIIYKQNLLVKLK